MAEAVQVRCPRCGKDYTEQAAFYRDNFGPKARVGHTGRVCPKAPPALSETYIWGMEVKA
jgi:hypothetical protein